MATNLLSKLKDVQLETLTSKAGKPYTTVTYFYVNGYKHRVFLNDEQEFAIRNAEESTNKNPA
jgi:hypothetical protein